MTAQTHGNLIVLNRKHAEVWMELYEAARDMPLRWKHEGACEVGFDDYDDSCGRCDDALIRRQKRLEAAVQAAGLEAQMIKNMFGPFNKE